ncbi:MAG: dTDP-4-dehydrorhamnose reductase [Sediminimonas qiaohouensis]|uniref:dTDP-4-dehydrorhamnose reductase n=1 Tax=Sediminimonas qiaohouensis TaxID=552061 RepID=A0A7C9LAE6_9RHOB|nr:dTDP-4-dehydrorhamnose reductase [Sediminimonas qiaohouensis]MTJ06073.1 dTDP-4-dehydrorhamnose reductase [Sediminimonas qiaohouensis]
MTVLVFGHSGQVATELRRQGQAEVISLDRNMADLRDPAACAAVIAQSSARAVINAAAYTAVDQAKTEEPLAHVVNAAAPGAMARACAARGIPFLHVSTDYVFDGTGSTFWPETAPTVPLNAYGRSKLAGEAAVHAAGGNALILRTSWVVSAHGTNFVKTMLRLSQTQNHLRIVADQIGGPTPAADIAETLLSAARAMIQGQPGGTYHYSGIPPVSWAGFARAIFKATGRTVTVEDIPTSAYPTPATRPLNSRLDCRKLHADFGIAPPDWQRGLHDILTELGEI